MKIWRYGLGVGRLIISVKFKWFDLWVGFYYDQMHGILYFVPIPTIAIGLQIVRRRKV